MEDTLALIARNTNVTIHRHSAVQVVMSLDDPYPATLGTQCFPAVTGFVIDSNIPHACESASCSVLVVSIDAFSHLGMCLRREILRGEAFRLFEDSACAGLASVAGEMRKTFSQTGTVDYRLLLSSVPSHGQPPGQDIDPRVKRVAEKLRRSFLQPAPMHVFADQVGLSQRRLRQLFQAQIGTSIRRFILWLRIRTAMRLISEGHELSEAAHCGGFSDQAHLTRVFKQIFGVSPAALRANAKFLAVFL